jgi:DNA polymerase
VTVHDAPPVLFDFESRSRSDLKRVGGRNYWAHPSTEALCAAWFDTATGDVGVWRPGEHWPHHGRMLGAHNMAGFDRFGAVRYGFQDAAAPWVDTSELARRAGFPGALEALGEWFGYPKDTVASKFTRGLSSCRRPSRGDGAITAAEWREFDDDQKRARGVQPAYDESARARVEAYCLGDVEIMAHAWGMLADWRDLEPEVERVDRAINDRGVSFDSELARRLIECDRANGERVLVGLAAELGVSRAELRDAASSPQQFTAMTGAENAQAATIGLMIATRAEGWQLAVARQALASIARGKLEAGLAHVSPDGRLRDNLRYYGGHTGRWSGKGMQLHNMPRPAKCFEDWSGDDIDRLACEVTAGRHHATQDEIELLVRATITADDGDVLVVEDFAGVEARCLALRAGDAKALAVFREGTRDPYKVAASIIFGVPYADVTKTQRTVGKTAELACGYGQGGRKFAETSAKMGADLDAAGVDSYAVVKAWRQLHAPICRFWRDVENAMVRACNGEPVLLAGYEFVPDDSGEGVAVFLPSGRPIVYRGMRVGADGSLVYDTAMGPEHTYGGKLVENIVQAECRCMLAAAMVRVDAAGLPIVLTVHDEIVCTVPAAVAKEASGFLHNEMLTIPEWAEGFPICAAGFTGKRYRK